MNSLASRLRSKTGLAIGVYLLACISLGLLAHAQINAMNLVPNSRPTVSNR